jgi:hypothetical protein
MEGRKFKQRQVGGKKIQREAGMEVRKFKERQACIEGRKFKERQAWMEEHSK